MRRTNLKKHIRINSFVVINCPLAKKKLLGYVIGIRPYLNDVLERVLFLRILGKDLNFIYEYAEGYCQEIDSLWMLRKS
jgi:hypothetical protein